MNDKTDPEKKKRGRPKKAITAADRVEFRCTEDEKISWEKKASREKKKLAAWLKDLANNAD